MNDAANCMHRQFSESQSYCPDCGLSRSEVLVAACEPFLKDGETPAECIARNRRDVDGCLTMLVAEKRKTEALRARLAEAEALRKDAMEAFALIESAPARGFDVYYAVGMARGFIRRHSLLNAELSKGISKDLSKDDAADSASVPPCPHPDVAIVGVAGDRYCACCGDPMPVTPDQPDGGA